MNFVYIGAFGILGVYSRYLMGTLISRSFPPPFPYGTFTINILGSFLIGMIYVFGSERGIISENLRLGFMVGFLGGFTTFSAYTLETARLLEEAEYLTALAYLGMSPILGLIGAVLGMFIARKMTGAVL